MSRTVTLKFEIIVPDGDDEDCIGDALSMLHEAIIDAAELSEIGEHFGDITSSATVSNTGD